MILWEVAMAHDPVPALLTRATQSLDAEFEHLPGYDPGYRSAGQESAAESDIAQILDAVARRMGDNYPYFHPLYAGQMLKPPHPVARAAYALAMKINPNNHARDGGRASSEMEMEAVRQIAAMFGWASSGSAGPGETGFLGHLTSSGTLANLNHALKNLTFTPTTGYNGSASIALSYTDAGNSLTASANIAITVGTGAAVSVGGSATQPARAAMTSPASPGSGGDEATASDTQWSGFMAAMELLVS